jgi:type IV pilus assembly protein PilC
MNNNMEIINTIKKYSVTFNDKLKKGGKLTGLFFNNGLKKVSKIKKFSSKNPLKKNDSSFVKIFNNLKSSSFFKMSLKEQTFFIKRLSFLLKAGIPILESLTMIREQTRQKSLVAILDTVIKDVSSGHTLSASLGKFHKIFGDFSINIISFGESAGILSDNLTYLAEELKKKNNLQKKVKGAFIYPAVVTLATLGITGFLMVYLFPKILPVFSSLHMTLPLSTRIIMALSNFLIHHGLALIICIIIFILAFIFTLKKVPTFRFYFDKFLMKIPMIGEVIKHYNLANTTRTIGLLLKSGVTFGETLAITTKVSGNLVYKREFEAMSEAINRGERVSVYLAKNRDLFPEVLTQIISVGERSGNLSNSFIYLSELYENEVEEFTKNISNLIEPALMIFMGVLVGFIAISIITPIYSITQNLHG